MKKRLWVLAFLLGGLLTACAARSAAPAPAVERGFPEDVAKEVVEMPLAAPAWEGGPEAMDETLPDDTERLVIRNAEVSAVVQDPATAMKRIAQMASEMGGYVVSSSLSALRLESGQEVPQARITVRVPAERFDEALDQVHTLAIRISHEEITGQDVTEEYVDLQARVHNLRAAEQQLQEIMDQATRTEDVLQVYRELTNIRGEIERLEGRIRYLEQSAALSAISVDLVPDEAARPLRIGGWEPQGVAKKAVERLVRTFQGLASLVIWLVIYVLPTLLVVALLFGLPGYLLGRWVWRRVGRRPPSEEEEEEA